MKKTKTKFGTLLICFFLLIASVTLMTACNNSADQEESSNMLTNIYTSLSFDVSDDFAMDSRITSYYNEADQTVTVFSTKRLEKENEDGEIENYRIGLINTFSMDGQLINSEHVPLDELGAQSPEFGTITEDALFFITYNISDTKYSISQYDRNTGEMITETENLLYFNVDDGTQVKLYASDYDGMQYISDGHKLFVFNPDLTLDFSLDFPSRITSMVRGADGNIWVAYYGKPETSVAKINTKNRAIGESYSFIDNKSATIYPSYFLLDSAALIDEVSFFYCDGTGIYSAFLSEENTIVSEKLMDLYNSNITALIDNKNFSSGSGTAIKQNAVLSKNLFLMSNSTDTNIVPILYIKADDIDLNTIETITVAYTTPLDSLMLDEINEFRTSHPEMRVVLSDYTVYRTSDNKNGAENQLCFDINNGILKPDIVITATPSSTISDDDAVYYLTRNNLYVDLVPYLEKDDELNFDTLFGCMRNIFDDGKDGMWGISREAEIATYIGDREILGEYAEKGSWTFDEMLDFFDSYLEDPEKDVMLGFVQYDLEDIFKKSVNSFYENGTYNFDNDTFVHYLEMLNSIPENYKQWTETSPNAEIDTNANDYDHKLELDAISLGKIGLLGYSKYTLSAIQYGGSVDERMLSDKYYTIGYPTNGDTCSTYAYAPDAYIITTFADNPDLCFEFLKEFIITDEYTTSGTGKNMGIVEDFLPAVKSQFVTATRTKRENVVDPFNDETLDKIADMFEDSGYPILELMPTAVYEIIAEEFSTYAGGMGTAEDCAKKIQSRVNIWVSEHE